MRGVRARLAFRPPCHPTAQVYEEWDFLSGLRYGWMPVLNGSLPAASQLGSCRGILAALHDAPGVAQPFPPESWYDPPVPPAAAAPSWRHGLGAAAALAPLAALFWGLWLWVARRRGLGTCCGDGPSAQASPRPAAGQYQRVDYGSLELAGARPATRPVALSEP